MFVEWRFRKMIPMSHDEYEREPARHLLWFHEFERMEG